MIFTIIIFAILCISLLDINKKFYKATENKDLHNQIKYGVYLIIGIITINGLRWWH